MYNTIVTYTAECTCTAKRCNTNQLHVILSEGNSHDFHLRYTNTWQLEI